MRAIWWAAALLVAVLTAWGLADAVGDFASRPGFDGVLRLVVEAVAGAVVVGFCVGKARSGAPAPDDGGSDGAAERQEGQARQADGT